MVVLALGVALAQEPGAAVCSRSIGALGGLTFGGRDFDLTTPGPYALSTSPMLSQTCFRVGKGKPGAATQSFTWLGYDAAPLLVHSYGRLGERAPIWGESSFGIGRRIGRNLIGLGLFTNSVEFGAGLRWIVRLDDDARFTTPSAELRLQVIPASDPEVRVGVLFTFAATRMDTGSAPMTPGPRLVPRRHDLADLSDSAQNHLRQLANQGGYTPTRASTRLAFGFEAGTSMGLRAEIRRERLGSAALRAVAVTAWRADAILQPSLLLEVNHRVGPTIDGGTTRRNGEWIPVGGAGWTLGGDAGLRLHAGFLAGPDYLVLDLGSVVTW